MYKRQVKHVTDITSEMLHAMKVKGMILDVDNTLSRHGCPIPFEGSIEWTHEMRAAGIKAVSYTHLRKYVCAAQKRLMNIWRQKSWE